LHRLGGRDTGLEIRYRHSQRKIDQSLEMRMADKEHKHGEMDTTEQEKTFDGFMKWSTNVGLFAIGVVIFMALFAR
jgi:hypothetical protein